MSLTIHIDARLNSYNVGISYCGADLNPFLKLNHTHILRESLQVGFVINVCLTIKKQPLCGCQHIWIAPALTFLQPCFKSHAVLKSPCQSSETEFKQSIRVGREVIIVAYFQHTHQTHHAACKRYYSASINQTELHESSFCSVSPILPTAYFLLQLLQTSASLSTAPHSQTHPVCLAGTPATSA